MKSMLIITRREILDKRLLFLGAALCAVIVLLIPLLPGARKENPVQVMTTAGLFLGFLFAGLATVALGAGIISRDLAERRMTFFLARPVNTLSVWLGKALAVLLIALGLGIIPSLIPTLLGGGLFSLDKFLTDAAEMSLVLHYLLHEPLQNLILLILLLTTLSLFLGLGMRARTPWLGLDFAVVAAVIGILWSVFRPLIIDQAERALAVLILSEVVLVILTIGLGNFLGFRRGRSDLQVSHKWTSLATAALVLGGTFAVAGYARWLVSFEIDEIAEAYVFAADNDSDWIAIKGRRNPAWNDYGKTFLLNARTGSSIPVTEVAGQRYGNPLIGLGGGIALAWEIRGIALPVAELVRIDLETGASDGLDILANWHEMRDFQVSPGGETAAWVIDDQIHTIDAESGRSLFSPKLGLDRSQGIRLRFQDPATLFAYVRADGRTIHRIDLVGKRVEITGTFPDGGVNFLGEELRLWRRDGLPELRNAQTGELVAVLPSKDAKPISGRRFVVAESGNATRIRILTSDGNVERTIELPGRGKLTAISEPTASSLLITLRGSEHLTTWFVDLGSEAVKEISREHSSLYWRWIFSTGTIPEPGSTVSRILQDREGQISVFDPETGTIRRLTGSD